SGGRAAARENFRGDGRAAAGGWEPRRRDQPRKALERPWQNSLLLALLRLPDQWLWRRGARRAAQRRLREPLPRHPRRELRRAGRHGRPAPRRGPVAAEGGIA